MSFPKPEITDVNRPFWYGLEQGRLCYQHCPACGNDWLPAREHCPSCLASGAEWKAASGRGKVVSWITYNMAYAPHLSEKLPYDVTIVELQEGPRLLTNIVDSEAGAKLSVDLPVLLAIETEHGVALPRFRMAPDGLTDES